MKDFYQIRTRKVKKGIYEVYPMFLILRSRDLMIQGHDFYAYYNDETSTWCRDEHGLIAMVDADMDKVAQELRKKHPDAEEIRVKRMAEADSGSIDKWLRYCQKQMRDNYHELDSKIIFASTKTRKTDYVSRRLSYDMAPGDYSAFDEIMSTLYDPSERDKLEWIIGAIISGDSKEIQKFAVLYGDAGSGKGTYFRILEMLFEGYFKAVSVKELTSANNSFAMSEFSSNPLVAIDSDGKLDRIEDNTKLNTLTSHEEMVVNEKYKAPYTMKFHTFLLVGTNNPVKITDPKSGLLRRLIDISPSGRLIPFVRYNQLMEKVKDELGAIADHCLTRYNELGRTYYDKYMPVEMMVATNAFYDFIVDKYDIFLENDPITLETVWAAYVQYVEESKFRWMMDRNQVRNELKSYYKEFFIDTHINGRHLRNCFVGFKKEKFNYFNNVNELEAIPNKPAGWIELEDSEGTSVFDYDFSDCLAQYANEEEKPSKRWDNTTTKLAEIDPTKVHYVRVPENLIVIDFDLTDENGEKSLERNIAAANEWPKTYAEVSKGGNGIHLHYFYDGDVSELSHEYDKGIEIKVFSGRSSLRRRLSLCNKIAIAVLTAEFMQLPKKGGKNVLADKIINDEMHLKNLIDKALRKEIPPGATKTSVDFICKVLDDAYESGMVYDLSTYRGKIITFAQMSTHHSAECLRTVSKMKFMSKNFENKEYEISNIEFGTVSARDMANAKIVFFDVEVFPNLFVVCWKFQGKDKDVVKMINPTPESIESLRKFRLVGFNNRRYDNHILYARLMGYSNEQLFKLSQNIINGSPNAMFGNAYGLSYTDIYDFCSKKQSLKKWEIELKIHHQELGLKWDQEVPEDMWDLVADYCCNDVLATEAVFDARHEDFVAREILAELSGLTVNDTTNQHTTKLIVGNDPHPQSKFVYTDLSTIYPGYKFDAGKSYYRGEEIGEGGYVYAEPGMYCNVVTFDVASMHPSSARKLNIFGEYTKNFGDLVDARLAIKHGDFELAGSLFNGKLVKYLEDKDQAKALSYALKIAINSVYGLTAAKFDNKLRDPRNIDNIVAKYGELFMIDLKNEVQSFGAKVVHIKTDSIKIENPSKDIEEFIMNFGKTYGFTFEIEAEYEKMCLVNKAVYIAKEKDHGWTATGDQFAQPYVFKTLFSHEPIELDDLCETKTVSTALYLDMNEGLEEGEHNYRFVGRAGQFCPIKNGCGGGELLREKVLEDGTVRYDAVVGTKGFRWLESETIRLSNDIDIIDTKYYTNLLDAAIDDISKYGDFEWFVSDDPVPPSKLKDYPSFVDIPDGVEDEELPWDPDPVVVA